jgi:hypothetical protein
MLQTNDNGEALARAFALDCFANHRERAILDLARSVGQLARHGDAREAARLRHAAGRLVDQAARERADAARLRLKASVIEVGGRELTSLASVLHQAP